MSDDTAPEDTPPAGVSHETAADEAATAPEKAPDNREAARYRRQLREAESTRDGLAKRLTAHQRRDAERIAAEALADPTDLWLAGTELDQLLDDDGLLDETKVRSAADAIVEQRPHWKPPTPPPSFDGGVRRPPARQAGWADVIGQARRQR